MKKKIIDTARKLFSQKGFYNTNSNEIATTTGVSIGSFYSYFSNKKHLFLEVLKDYNEQMSQAIKPIEIEKINDIEIFLNNFINNLLDSHKFDPDFHKVISLMELHDEEVKKILDDQKIIVLEYICKYLTLWQKQITVDDLKIAAFMIYCLVEKSIHEIVFYKTNFNEKKVIKEIVKIIKKYLFTV